MFIPSVTRILGRLGQLGNEIQQPKPPMLGTLKLTGSKSSVKFLTGRKDMCQTGILGLSFMCIIIYMAIYIFFP